MKVSKALTGDEYADALQVSSARGIVGGGIYDAMLGQCAIKAQAETIYTWNARHYALCAPEVTQRLRTLDQLRRIRFDYGWRRR